MQREILQKFSFSLPPLRMLRTMDEVRLYKGWSKLCILWEIHFFFKLIILSWENHRETKYSGDLTWVTLSYSDYHQGKSIKTYGKTNKRLLREIITPVSELWVPQICSCCHISVEKLQPTPDLPIWSCFCSLWLLWNIGNQNRKGGCLLSLCFVNAYGLSNGDNLLFALFCPPLLYPRNSSFPSCSVQW